MPFKYNPFTGELDYFEDAGMSAVQDIDADSGTATPSGGTIVLSGGTGINTSAAGNTVTINLDDPVLSEHGGTGRTSLTQGSVLVGDGTNPVYQLPPLTDGQLLIGDTAGIYPNAANLSAPASGISITSGAGSITFALTDDLAALEALPNFGIAARTSTSVWNTRTLTGTTDFIAITNGDGISANPTFDIDTNFKITGMHGWNGAVVESPSVTVTSDGATITFSVEKSGGGDLTLIYSDGYYSYDTTPAKTVSLSAGTDTTPQINYVFIPQSTKTLTANTTGFPSTEHVPLATVLCQSAASLQTDGAYKVHAWTDHVTTSNDQGHISDVNYWIRHQHATWQSGVTQTYTITTNGGAADNVILTTAAGEVLQLHNHDFPAFSGTPTLYVVNDSATPYTKVTDLNALLTDSAGGSLSGRYFSLVIWGVVSEDTGDCKLMVNLPSGSYGNQNGVLKDTKRYANYDIPSDFRGTGFLISEWKLRHQTAASGTWTSIDEIDLRGLLPSIDAGGTGIAPEFADNEFRIFDDLDNTKLISFQASGITAGNTREITMADQDIDLTPTTGTYQGSDATLTALAAYNTNGLLTQTAADTFTGRTITAGSGITVTNGDGVAGNPTIASSGGGLAWTEVTGVSQNMSANNGYIANNAALVTLTLPATAALGDTIVVLGKGAGKFKIAQNAGQTIRQITTSSTTGVGGSFTADDQYNQITLRCITANTDFIAETTGAFTVA